MLIKKIIQQLVLIIMRSSILVGGQAVINGVMMRVPGAYSTAVRLENGEIASKTTPFKSINEEKGYQKIPIIRGAIGLYEAMKIGYSTLNWSAIMAEQELDQKSNKITDIIMNLAAILFAVSLFILSPIFVTKFFVSTTDAISFNVFAGIIRISIFITYLLLISTLKDVRTLFQYHGAEHKTIFTFENGQKLSYANTKKHKKEHPRCGTSFLFIVMLVSIFSFSALDGLVIFFLKLNELPTFGRLLIHIFCMPLVAGFSYEVLKFLAKYMDKNYLVKILCMPGLLLQKITTKEPDEKQLEVAFKSLKTAFGDKYESIKGGKYKADAIG
ncbi:MAG: hypothetical protein CMG00_09360 [Candidatus Marinimicrobia bacterium]|nr:hypothetical protein [Candidatus Neomarinimicrobiota bacterium]|tara:strand:+ start:16772 stop:17755 length:984 start_codon:yes stop_codon:yes gene_type:complete